MDHTVDHHGPTCGPFLWMAPYQTQLMDAPRPLKIYDWPPKSLPRIFTTYPYGPYSGPPWIHLWTTFMNGPLLNSTYGWPQTTKNLWMAPKKFCQIHRNTFILPPQKFVMAPLVAYESPQNQIYGCPQIFWLISSSFLLHFSRFLVLFSILEILISTKNWVVKVWLG